MSSGSLTPVRTSWICHLDFELPFFSSLGIRSFRYFHSDTRPFNLMFSAPTSISSRCPPASFVFHLNRIPACFVLLDRVTTSVLRACPSTSAFDVGLYYRPYQPFMHMTPSYRLAYPVSFSSFQLPSRMPAHLASSKLIIRVVHPLH